MRTRLYRTIGTLICALCTGTAALGQPTLPKIESADFANTAYTLPNGFKGQPVTVPSASPADYGTLMRGDTGPLVKLTAQLFLPPTEVRHG